ncbi:glycosyltransferase family A protein [Roseomonas sp. HF4]|uniref:glycosyltransferase family A protein n=1 Tax=Roseomonas sp. HF4 TaxID=2562313 RepID=UPI0010C0C75A|nr:glycosyltransferase family A protein [Roseomonas sp. HF4]
MTGRLLPGTTLCVPAWNATTFLAETLEAVARQQVPGLRVLVSIDGADAGTAAVCDAFLGDARFARIVQPRRLGWVGNTNALIEAVETEHVAIMPHDDLPADDWLVSLHAALAADPDAVGAYADLEAFGTSEFTFAQPEIVGPGLARRLETMLHQCACVAFRGLFRLRPGQPRPLLPAGLPGDIAADTAWLMELACRGALRRVPRILVRKRYHDRNTHGAWWSLPPETDFAAGIAVLDRMARRASHGLPGGRVPVRLVAAAALLRLLDCADPWPFLRAAPMARRVAAWLGTDGLTGLLPDAGDVLACPEAVALRACLAEPACAPRLAEIADGLRGSPWHGALGVLARLATEVAAAVPDGAVSDRAGGLPGSRP